MSVNTVVIGLDGVPWDYLDKAIDKGYCPTIESLIHNGISGKLRSTTPPISPVAWSSFITGKSPNNHGIFDWQLRENKNGRLRLVSAQDRYGTPFWEYLGSHSLRTGVVGIPLTFPVAPLDGFMVSGFDSIWNSDRCCWPTNLRQILSKEFGTRADIIFSSLHNFPKENDLLKYRADQDDMSTDAAIYLSDILDIDTLVINYMTVDHLNHSANDENTILKGFISFEKNIRKVLEAYPNSHMLIMSDHGSYRNRGGFLICEVLRDTGLLEFNNRDIGKEHHMELLVRFLQGSLKLSGLGEKLLRRLLYYVLNYLPNGAKNRIWRRIYDFNERIFHLYWNLDKDRSLVELSTGFKASVAELYLKYPQITGLGKNPDEIIQIAKKKLSKVIDDSGNRYFIEIHNGTSFFSGDYSDRAPDIIAIGNTKKPDFDICLNYPMGGNSKVNGLFAYEADLYAYLMKGTHSLDGIYIFNGKEFNQNQNGPLINIIDIPFILLSLKGVPIPNDFDGQIYPELFKEHLLSKSTISYQEAVVDSEHHGHMAADEESEILARLKQLGYI